MPAPLPEESKQFIRDVWSELTERGSSTSGASVLRVALSKWRDDPNYAHLREPKLRTTEEIVGHLNKQYSGLSPEQKALDEPWCLGVSVKLGISSEANADLLKIYKWCTLVGRPFTIREAKWVAQLRGVVSRTDLLRIASNYAAKERIYEMELASGNSHDRFDTADLDAFISFRPLGWEYHTGCRLGLYPELRDWRGMAESTPRILDLDLDSPASMVEWAILPCHDKYKIELVRKPDEMQKIIINDKKNQNKEPYLLQDAGELPDQEEAVYAMWLVKMSNQPAWETLDLAKKVNVANQLHNEVRDVCFFEQIGLATSGCEYSTLAHMAFTRELEKRWEPSAQLLHTVGLKPWNKVWEE